MIASTLINDLIPPLKATENAEKAIIWMEELKTNELPVIQENRFLGLISEEIVFESGNLDEELSQFELIGHGCFVYENQHLFDVIKMTFNHDVQLVAVLNMKNEYMGVIDSKDLIGALAQTEFIQAQGAILELAINQVDYSLSELARLIEAENATVLSSYTRRDLESPDRLIITLKLNKDDLTHVIATLERFGYQIEGRYKDTRYVNNDKERLDQFFRYLDI